MPRTLRRATHSLRWHLLWLVAAAVVPAIVFSAALILRTAEQQRLFLTDQIDDSAAVIADDVDTKLRQTIAALEVLAASNAAVGGDLVGFGALAQRVLETHPDWASLQLLGGTDGRPLARLPRAARAPVLPGSELYAEVAASGRPHVSDVMASGNQALIVVTVPVFHEEGVIDVLAAAFRAPDWESFLRRRLPPGMEALLVDRRLKIISRTPAGVEGSGMPPAEAIVQAMLREREGGVVRGPTLEGVDAYGAYRLSRFSGWTVSVFMPVDAIEAPVRASLAVLAVGFFLILLGSVALARMFTRRISTSMRQLSASVRSVGSGSGPLPVKDRIDEVREASQALEDAAQLLDERLARERGARSALEAADRAKDEFLGMLSHELRNPLAPITAALYILEDAERESDAARGARSVIARQVGHLGRLVDDLLDVTRIASGKVALRRESVSLNEILRRAAEDYAEIARKRSLELRLDLPSDEIRMNGDPTRLAQIAGNLLQNALKFTPPGGTVELSLARRGESAEISVRDTGEGMERALLERLFQPFVQGRQGAVARGGLGLGLGLALVKGFAALHGGSVRASSDGAGTGSLFTVSLPLGQAEAA